MKVYIAAPVQLQTDSKILRALLREAGFTVTSRWIDADLSVEVREQEGAAMDLLDICASDAVVLINPERFANLGTGGRHFECGFAAALAIPIVILGARSHVFHHMPDVTLCADIYEVIQCLSRS